MVVISRQTAGEALIRFNLRRHVGRAVSAAAAASLGGSRLGRFVQLSPMREGVNHGSGAVQRAAKGWPAYAKVHRVC